VGSPQALTLIPHRKKNNVAQASAELEEQLDKNKKVGEQGFWSKWPV